MLITMIGVSSSLPVIDNPYLSILINRRDLGHSFDLGVNKVNQNLVITGERYFHFYQKYFTSNLRTPSSICQLPWHCILLSEILRSCSTIPRLSVIQWRRIPCTISVGCCRQYSGSPSLLSLFAAGLTFCYSYFRIKYNSLQTRVTR